MDKYISDLLKSHDRLIIPDLGAFMVMKDKEDHIVFNEFLQFNDGILIKYVAEKEGLDAGKALARVEEWVANAKKKLDGKGHTITGFGELAKDDKGKIQFALNRGPAKKTTAKPVGKKKEPSEKEVKQMEPESKPPAKTTPEPEKEEKKESKTRPVTEPVKEVKKPETKSPEQPEQQVPKEKNELGNQVVTGKPSPPKTKHKSEVRLEKDGDGGPVGEKPPWSDLLASEQKEDPETEKKEIETEKRQGYLLWLIVVLVIIILFVLWFLFIRKKPAVPETIPIPPTVEKVVEEPPPAVEETPVSETAPQPEQVPPVIVKKDPAWYVVAGGFEIEKNADDYVQELRAKGFNAEKFGTSGPLYLVSFESFKNRREAILKLRQVRWDLEPDAWMIHY